MQVKQGRKFRTVKMLPATGIVSNEVKDHSKDPFFIKKAEAAKKNVDRIVVPKTFLAK